MPRGEGRGLAACSFSHVKFPGRAPADRALLRCFLDGRAAEGAGGDGLEGLARDELRRLLGITAPPLFARPRLHVRSMAQYEVGHLDRVAAIERTLGRHPGLALAGNGLRGVGIPDCVRSGESAAESVLAAPAVISLRA